MRFVAIFLAFLMTVSVHAADMQAVGTAEAEAKAEQAAAEQAKREAEERAAAEKAAAEEAERKAAEEAAKAAAEAEAERLAREEAERKAAEAARQEAERAAAAEAEKLAREEAERKAAEAARQEAERAAAAEAEKLAREEAERKAAEAERAAREKAERAAAEAERAAREATEREAAQREAQSTPSQASALAASSQLASASQTGSCGVPPAITNEDAATAIAERARSDAAANAQTPAQLILTAADSVATLVSQFALDARSVGQAYFFASCTALTESGGTLISLKGLLASLAESLGLTYPPEPAAQTAEARPAAAADPSARDSEQLLASADEGASESARAPESEPPAAPSRDIDTQTAAETSSGASPAQPQAPAAPRAAAPEAAAPADQPTLGAAKAQGGQAPAASSAPSPTGMAERRDAPPTETPAPGASSPQAGAPADAAPAAKTRAGRAGGGLGEEQCRALGVLGHCPDLNAVLDQLLEKPLEYNHPKQMLMGRKNEIALVLRTDWEGDGLPPEVSEELKNLPGEVKQGLTKITQIMSAELSGADFEIAPSGRQERTIVPPQPASWNWQVTPTETGPGKTLRLRLYAHLQAADGAMPPILIKTLDATIDVDVTAWDWVLSQARTLEPVYSIGAALLGLLLAIMTYILARRHAAAQARNFPEAGGYFDKPDRWEPIIKEKEVASGPVIGDLDQSVADGRPPAASAPPVPPASPTPQPPAIPTVPAADTQDDQKAETASVANETGTPPAGDEGERKD